MVKIKQLTKNDGFSGVEISVAIILLMIFVSLISMLFTNIYLSYTGSKRNSEATAYATQIIEQIQKMYYADVTNANLAQKVLEMNIPRGYGVQIQVDNYNEGDNTKEDLVKNVIITINYRVGQQTKSVKFETVKAKEILITPNKPKLSNGMVPVKYVITDRTTNNGYWQITAEDDPTWYSYENRKWAAVMKQKNLTVEGGTTVTKNNAKQLVGKKIETYEEILVWIPRFAYSADEITFLYNITNNYIDENGDMKDIVNKENYTVHSAFGTGATGLWFSVYSDTTKNVETVLSNISSEVLQNELLGAVNYLVYSKYGNIINIIENKMW